MEISDRIRLIRESAGLTRAQFAERLGISASEVTNVEFAKIKNMASKESLFRSIASEFDVSLDWIKTGEGDMYGATPRDDVAMAFGSLLAMHDPVVDGFIEFFRSRTPEQRRDLVEQLRELVALIDKHSTESEG
nr:MAG TPA: helix-turn-helix domain protein [Caudoviricetes sp.]